ncbi:hypothetical protein JYT33_01245, partial [Alkaliphilus transvaalensis]|nr:hypothetical protein [Alkaliphilus transvaalensis]
MSKLRIKEVSIEDLKKGMKLAKDVISQRGNILLPKGQKLEEIQRTQTFLEQHDIYFVFVEEDQTNVTTGIEPKTELEKEVEEIELFREDYLQVRSRMQNDFEKILQGEN